MHARAGRRASRRSIDRSIAIAGLRDVHKRSRSFSMPLISQPTQSTVDPSTNFITIFSPLRHPTPNRQLHIHAASLHARARAHHHGTARHGIASHRIPSVEKRPKLSTQSSTSTSKNVKPFDSAIFSFVSIAKLSRAAVTATQLEAIAFCVKVGSKWTNHTPPFSTNRSSPHVDQPRPTGSAGAVYNRALAGRDI
jgi:hypothetical protein